jgi:hypothetical protein
MYEYLAEEMRTLERVLEDGDDTLELFGGQVTGALGKVDIGLLADQVGVSATDTLDLGHRIHDLLLAIDVRVQQTDNVLEAVTSQHHSQRFASRRMAMDPASSTTAAHDFPQTAVQPAEAFPFPYYMQDPLKFRSFFLCHPDAERFLLSVLLGRVAAAVAAWDETKREWRDR